MKLAGAISDPIVKVVSHVDGEMMKKLQLETFPKCFSFSKSLAQSGTDCKVELMFCSSDFM